MLNTPQQPTQLVAGCKVNIFLEIHGLRDDGYHDISTLFLPLPTPCDIISITPARLGTGLRLTCSDQSVQSEQNILSRCYELFCRTSGIRPDLNVHLHKNIPVGAGLGGGSSDAARFLTFLNESAGASGLDSKTLLSLAGKLGADVPFFLLNRPAWAIGRGDQLVPLQLALGGLTMLLVCPRVHVSTAWAYLAWDEEQVTQVRPLFPLTPQIGPDIVITLSNFIFHNSFETPVFRMHPELRAAKEMLLAFGASGAVMSGSGASLFAVFRDPKQAEKASLTIQKQDMLAFVYPPSSGDEAA